MKDFKDKTKIEILRSFGYEVEASGHQFKGFIVDNPEAFTVVADSEVEVIDFAYEFLLDEVDPDLGYIFPETTTNDLPSLSM